MNKRKKNKDKGKKDKKRLWIAPLNDSNRFRVSSYTGNGRKAEKGGSSGYEKPAGEQGTDQCEECDQDMVCD